MWLESKVAIVTGSAKGIGRSTALLFGQEGAAVVGVDIDREAGQRTRADIVASGGNAAFVYADVSNADQVQEAISTTLRTYGKLDILVNNAGTHRPKGVEQLTEQEWDDLMRINAKSVFLCSKLALAELRKTKGTIISMASLVGLTGQRNSAGYAASKGAIIALTKSMALDLASEGIRVNCICPAAVRTPLLEDWLRQKPDREELLNRMGQIHPIGRMAESEEIARVALFLASQQASFITGVALTVDGGASLGF